MIFSRKLERNQHPEVPCAKNKSTLEFSKNWKLWGISVEIWKLPSACVHGTPWLPLQLFGTRVLSVAGRKREELAVKAKITKGMSNEEEER